MLSKVKGKLIISKVKGAEEVIERIPPIIYKVVRGHVHWWER
jgi:hypothetical protein